jgi:DNA-binding NarL/FixJ family response regulator
MRTSSHSPGGFLKQPRRRPPRISAKPTGPHYVLIIDSRKLRQAGIMRLLEAWAEALDLEVTAIEPHASLNDCHIDASCEMVILNVGSTSVEHPQQQVWIKSVRTLIPDASLVIFSDRDEPSEVCAAFEAGAEGFLPTSTEPSVALQALSFIMGGGSFFPPYALSHRILTSSTSLHTGQNAALKLPDQAGESVERFTPKQEEVFELLRQGHSNKLIARQLSMSEATVKVHVRQIMRKFGASNRTQAVVSAMK